MTTQSKLVIKTLIKPEIVPKNKSLGAEWSFLVKANSNHEKNKIIKNLKQKEISKLV